MSRLPEMVYTDKIKKAVQVSFGGLRHSLSCGDGELYDMKNMTCREYPILQPREKRKIALDLGDGESRYTAIYAEGGEMWYVEAERFDNGNEAMRLYATQWPPSIAVTIAEDIHDVEMIRFGNRMIVMPDKLIIKTQYRIDEVPEATVEKPFPTLTEQDEGRTMAIHRSGRTELWRWNGSAWKFLDDLTERMEDEMQISGVKITGGYILGQKATANTLTFTESSKAEFALRDFKVGDAVEISGLKEAPGNDKTAVIQGIKMSTSGDNEIAFSDNCFQMPLGTDGKPVEEVTISGEVTIRRNAPDMEFCFEHDNRLWGCKGKNIYASKLGDPRNWNVFEGLSTDSWALETQKKGDLTGGVSYGGYPTMFREDAMVRIYGATPQTFQGAESAMQGVRTGEHKSIAAAGGALIYLSREGMMLYDGEYPKPLRSVFGTEEISGAIAASDGTRYYAQLKVEGERALYCFDSGKGIWMKEDDPELLGMTYDQGTVYGLVRKDENGGNRIIDISGSGDPFDGETAQETEPVESFAEFGDFTDGSLNRKAMSKLQLRMELEDGASVQISVQYDGGEWETMWYITQGKKRSIQIPIVPRRCDHYRLKITGTGMWRLYAMARERYEGSEIN